MAGVFSISLRNLALFFCWPLQCQILGVQSFPFKIIDICYCFLADSISKKSFMPVLSLFFIVYNVFFLLDISIFFLYPSN